LAKVMQSVHGRSPFMDVKKPCDLLGERQTGYYIFWLSQLFYSKFRFLDAHDKRTSNLGTISS